MRRKHRSCSNVVVCTTPCGWRRRSATTSANRELLYHARDKAFPVEKSAGRTALRKRDDKCRDTRSIKETLEVREYEGVSEKSEGENQEDEQNEVYLEDQGQSEDLEKFDEEDQ